MVAEVYELETAPKKVQASIESIENLCSVAIPKCLTAISEISVATGSENVKKDGEAFDKVSIGFIALFKDLVGEEGDSVQEGTLYGVLNALKRMNIALNGGV